MFKLEQILYTAETITTGGRDGKSKSSDNLLNVNLALPTEMGGQGNATNPEQLFAAGYSACFIGALKFVAEKQKLKLPDNLSIEAKVSIGTIPPGFGISVQMLIDLPGLDKQVAQDLIQSADKVCPYSNATRGNIEVALSLK